ncbi:hypothetical protein [Actinacidiphila glaucinigra]|uniref:hypothetical protein n=1 Tax=Actinacidiphila glaucinigra TaxID=235986 RepID=UPI0036E79D2B
MRARLPRHLSGLRLDATAGGVRMNGVLSLASGHVRFAVDLDRGPDCLGKPLDIPVLRPGSGAPAVAEVVPATAGSLAEFTVPLDVEDGAWVVLRISTRRSPTGSPGRPDTPATTWVPPTPPGWWPAP